MRLSEAAGSNVERMQLATDSTMGNAKREEARRESEPPPPGRKIIFARRAAPAEFRAVDSPFLPSRAFFSALT